MQQIILDTEASQLSAELAHRSVAAHTVVQVTIERNNAKMPLAAVAKAGLAFDWLANGPDLDTNPDLENPKRRMVPFGTNVLTRYPSPLYSLPPVEPASTPPDQPTPKIPVMKTATERASGTVCGKLSNKRKVQFALKLHRSHAASGKWAGSSPDFVASCVPPDCTSLLRLPLILAFIYVRDLARTDF